MFTTVFEFFEDCYRFYLKMKCYFNTVRKESDQYILKLALKKIWYDKFLKIRKSKIQFHIRKTTSIINKYYKCKQKIKK